MSQNTDTMIALALIVIVVLAVALSFGLDIAHAIKHWWTGQMQEAERRAALPKIRAPLLSINISNRPTDYVDDEEMPPSGARSPVPPDTYQAIPPGTASLDTSMVPPDPAALARHLAELKQPNGLHWLSANKIVSVVPGNRNEVLAIVREVRGESEAPTSDPQFPESTKDGRAVASHLRTQARRS